MHKNAGKKARKYLQGQGAQSLCKSRSSERLELSEGILGDLLDDSSIMVGLGRAAL